MIRFGALLAPAMVILFWPGVAVAEPPAQSSERSDSEAAVAAAYATFRAGEPPRPRPTPEPEYSRPYDMDLSNAGLFLMSLAGAGVLVSTLLLVAEKEHDEDLGPLQLVAPVLLGSAAVGSAGAAMFFVGRRRVPLRHGGPTRSAPAVAVGLSGIHGTF